jgi:hypothetical protein
MKDFNNLLSHIRIASEHAFGLLKGHFLSLMEMGEHKDIQVMYKAIEAMLILHNIFIDWDDHPERIWNFTLDSVELWPGWDGDEDVDEDVDNHVVSGNEIARLKIVILITLSMLIVMFRASELGGLQDTSSDRPSLTPSVPHVVDL